MLDKVLSREHLLEEIHHLADCQGGELKWLEHCEQKLSAPHRWRLRNLRWPNHRGTKTSKRHQLRCDSW